MQSQSTDTQPEVSQVQAAIKVPPIQANTCQQVSCSVARDVSAHAGLTVLSFFLACTDMIPQGLLLPVLFCLG